MQNSNIYRERFVSCKNNRTFAARFIEIISQISMRK